jgi:predicted RNA-binding Zn-ribbon protein involved in translation (DUF1610 family)
MSNDTHKCLCTSCSGHIEFDGDYDGEEIECPHCGMTTVLYRLSTNQNKPINWLKDRRVIWGLSALAILICGLVLGWFLNKYWSEISSGIGFLGGGALGLALSFFLIVLGILWFTFPFVVYWYLRLIRIEIIRSNSKFDRACDLLKRIELGIHSIDVPDSPEVKTEQAP